MVNKILPAVQTQLLLSAIHCKSTLDVDAAAAFSAGGNIG